MDHLIKRQETATHLFRYTAFGKKKKEETMSVSVQHGRSVTAASTVPHLLLQLPDTG